MYQTKTIPQLSFTEALTASTNKILQFSGRSRRSEYWWTMLPVITAIWIITPIGLLLSIATIPLTVRRLHDIGRSGWWCLGYLLPLFILLTFIIDIVSAVYVSDTIINPLSFFSKYAVFVLITLVYKVLIIIFMCIDSQPFANEYGESPKYVDEIIVDDDTAPGTTHNNSI